MRHKYFECTAERPRAGLGVILLSLGFPLLFAGRARAQTPPAPFTVERYLIDAQLLPSTHTLSAKVVIRFTPQSDINSLSFELNSALKVDKVLDASGKSLGFRQDGQTMVVNLLDGLKSGGASAITVTYSGSLASAEGSPVENLKLAYVGPEGSYLLYPGRWFPVAGFARNRFAATMRVTVPPGEVVIASGKPSVPEREAGKVTYSFEYDKPSFPGTVLAGNYKVMPGTAVGAEITLYLKPGNEKYAGPYSEAAGRILSFFSDKFGPLPDSHMAIVEIADDTVGGYSAPGVLALASRGFGNPVDVGLLAHEISHQWWRCLVSPATRNDAYLDDGLATYSKAIYIQEAEGEAAFESLMRDTSVGALTHEEVAPISQAGQLHEFTPEYESLIFDKGAMVFHMLRWVIGDDAFFKALQALGKEYAWKGVTSDEFQKLAESSSHQELTYFFALWVTSTGVPQFKRSWATYRTADAYQVVGKIQQDLDIFRMPVEVRIYSRGRKPVDQRVDMVGTTADFTINTVFEPERVVVDPASRLLKYDDQTRIDVEMTRGDQLEQQQAYLEAISQYRKVLDLNKNSSLAHYRLGEIYFKLRNYNAAIEDMRSALDGDLQPKWVEVWAHLTIGKVFDITGQRDRALNEYQRALQTNNNAQGALDEANKYIQHPYSEPPAAAGNSK
ncbi:MAG: peptidase M1 [Acidobacteria bacterium]|nr:MAG: peptidase M1 [Acidobacteriota bacterium]